MKIYFAGWEYGRSSLFKTNSKIKNVLHSFFYCKNKPEEYFKETRVKGKNIFLDSGAFSALSKDEPINLGAYIRFIHKIKPYLELYAGLDDISNPEKTWNNQQEMEKEGLNPLICYHYGESLKYLDMYCEKYEYLAIGGMVPIDNTQLLPWLEDIFDRYPNKKFHGFGLTSFELMEKFPWYSTDSTSWQQGGRFGRVLLINNRVLNFSKDMIDDNHWSVLNDTNKYFYINLLRTEYPEITIEDLLSSYKERDDCNALTMLKKEKLLTDNPPVFKKVQNELFQLEDIKGGKMKTEIKDASQIVLPEKESEKAVLILSGGLDSTTLLWDMKKQEYDIYAITFNYSQRHKKEIDSAIWNCRILDVSHKIIDISEIGKQLLQGSSLTSDIKVPAGHYADENMKKTVVPNRNMILLSLSIGYAISIGAKKVFYGAHSGDHTIYPDCRPEFIKAMQETANLCDWEKVEIMAPYSNLTKVDIVKIGLNLGVDYSNTWTCYEGKELPCGVCGSCNERAEAFRLNNQLDPLISGGKNANSN